jgi:hypothetical protein
VPTRSPVHRSHFIGLQQHDQTNQDFTPLPTQYKLSFWSFALLPFLVVSPVYASDAIFGEQSVNHAVQTKSRVRLHLAFAGPWQRRHVRISTKLQLLPLLFFSLNGTHLRLSTSTTRPRAKPIVLTATTVILHSSATSLSTPNMSAPAAAPVGSLTIVDLTEGMDDLDVESQSGAEDVGEEELKPICVGAAAKKKKKVRKGRHGGRSKKVKAMEKASKLSKLQEDKNEDEDEDDGTLCLFAMIFR